MDNYMLQNKNDKAYLFSIIIHPLASSKSMHNKELQHVLIKNIPIIHLSINLSLNIGIRYNFYRHYCLKNKVALSLSLSINIVALTLVD